MSRDTRNSDPAKMDVRTDDKLSGHERQVHHRNRTEHEPSEEGYVGVPPGEEGQYGMRRSDSTEPLDTDSATDTGSTDKPGVPDGHAPESFDDWRRKQTAPDTNVGAPPANKKDK
jgi:hypothetical protein